MSYYLNERPVMEDIAPHKPCKRHLCLGITTQVDTKILLKQIAAARAAAETGIFEIPDPFKWALSTALKPIEPTVTLPANR